MFPEYRPAPLAPGSAQAAVAGDGTTVEAFGYSNVRVEAMRPTT